MRAFGLEHVDSSNLMNQSDSEWYRFASEVRLSDLKVDIHKLQNRHKKLTEDIRQSQKSIKALNEYVDSHLFKLNLMTFSLVSQMSSDKSEWIGN